MASSDTALIIELRQRVRDLEDRVELLETFLYESDLVPDVWDGAPSGRFRELLGLLLNRKIVNTKVAAEVLGTPERAVDVYLCRMRRFLRAKYAIELQCVRGAGHYLSGADKGKIRASIADAQAALAQRMQ